MAAGLRCVEEAAGMNPRPTEEDSIRGQSVFASTEAGLPDWTSDIIPVSVFAQDMASLAEHFSMASGSDARAR